MQTYKAFSQICCSTETQVVESSTKAKRGAAFNGKLLATKVQNLYVFEIRKGAPYLRQL